MGGKPHKGTQADMRLSANRKKFGTVANRNAHTQRRASNNTSQNTAPAYDYSSPSFGASNSTVPRKKG